MRREIMVVQNQNLDELLKKVDSYHKVKSDTEITELRENIFVLNQEVTRVTEMMHKEKHVFSSQNIDLL